MNFATLHQRLSMVVSNNNTNLNHLESHKIIINDTTFLAFNYSTDIYIGNLSKKIKLVELEDYIC